MTLPHRAAVAVADGLGSAQLASVGARTAVCSVLRAVSSVSALPDQLEMLSCVSHARRAVSEIARRSKREVRQFGTTLGVALLTEDCVFVAQVGDCLAIAEAADHSFSTIAPPEKFEYVNQTRSLSADDLRPEHVRLTTLGRSDCISIALSTDGLKYKILEDLFSYAPFGPFFDETFRYARQPTATNAAIHKFLDTMENDQTFDDKTLVVAVRTGSPEGDGVLPPSLTPPTEWTLLGAAAPGAATESDIALGPGGVPPVEIEC